MAVQRKGDNNYMNWFKRLFKKQNNEENNDNRTIKDPPKPFLIDSYMEEYRNSFKNQHDNNQNHSNNDNSDNTNNNEDDDSFNNNNVTDTDAESLEDFDMSWLSSPEDRAYDEKNHNYEHELRKHFGYDSFREHQKQIVELLATKNNVLASCPTAFGKSICYQLPALMMPGMTIVVSPLISLMKDQVDNLQKKGIYSGGYINSTQTTDERQKEIKRIFNNEIKILYVSPERLASRSFLEILKSVKIGLLIVDEAHCISQWGHDFRPDYLNIKNIRWEIHPAAIGMFTATATEEIKKDIIQQVGLYEDEDYKKEIKEYYVNRVEINNNRDNLKNVVIPVDSNSQKYHAIIEIANTIKGKGIIYCGTRKKVKEVAKHLDNMKIKSDYYHAGRSEDERLYVQNSFFSDEGIQVIVATNAFGMGIDKPDIRYVIHWDMPGTLENYVQEAGRAGRDGKQSACILFYKPGDEELHEYFAKEAKIETDVLYNTYKYIYNSKTVGKDKYDHKYKAIHQDVFDQDLQIPEDKTKIMLSQLNTIGLIRWYPNLPYIFNIEVKAYEKDEKLQHLATQDQHQISELCKKFNMNPEDLYCYLIEQKAENNLNFWGKEESLIFNVSNHGAPLAKDTILFTTLFYHIKSCHENKLTKSNNIWNTFAPMNAERRLSNNTSTSNPLKIVATAITATNIYRIPTAKCCSHPYGYGQ